MQSNQRSMDYNRYDGKVEVIKHDIDVMMKALV